MKWRAAWMGSMAALTMCSSAAFASPAQGAPDGNSGPSIKKELKVKPVKPAEVTPALPTVEAPAPAQKPTFPALPPSRPCAPEDMKGAYRLLEVYEDPQGVEISTFRVSPVQYLFFKPNNVFVRVNLPDDSLSVQEVIKRSKEHSAGLLQYILQDNGFVYFYQDSVATDVKACFIVADNRIPFKKGQMILMPPKGQAQGRLAKVYDKISAPLQEEPPADTPSVISDPSKRGTGGRGKKGRRGRN